MENDRVHATHCCVDHGCKYGKTNCPVTQKKVSQEYPCEVCDYDEEVRNA